MRASSTKRLLVGFTLMLAAAGVACGRGESAEPIGSISRVEGDVELTSAGETKQAVEGRELFPGDILQTDGSGNVAFGLAEAGSYELWRGRAAMDGPGRIRLADALVVVSADERSSTDFERIQVLLADGNVRVETGSEGRVANYDAQEMTVIAGDQEIPLPPLWQLTVTAEGALDHARPLQFSREDRVDARYLAHALDVDSKLANLLRGVESQLAAADGTRLNERLLAAGISPGDVALFGTTPRSDVLMGLAFAREWVSADIPAGFKHVMALHTLGATWGLIAQSVDVPADALVASLQDEITAVLFPQGPGVDGRLVPTPLPTVFPPSSPGRPTARPPAPPPPAPAPPAAAPGSPSPTPSPGLVGPVVDPLRPLLPDELEAIIDELLGLVNGVAPLL